MDKTLHRVATKEREEIKGRHIARMKDNTWTKHFTEWLLRRGKRSRDDT